MFFWWFFFIAPVTVNSSLHRMSNFYPYCPLDPPMSSKLPQSTITRLSDDDVVGNVKMINQIMFQIITELLLLIIFDSTADGHVTPPIPDRTPESFVLPTEQRELIVASMHVLSYYRTVQEVLFCFYLLIYLCSSWEKHAWPAAIRNNTTLTQGGSVIWVGWRHSAQEVPWCSHEQEQGNDKYD